MRAAKAKQATYKCNGEVIKDKQTIEYNRYLSQIHKVLRVHNSNAVNLHNLFFI